MTKHAERGAWKNKKEMGKRNKRWKITRAHFQNLIKHSKTTRNKK
jgi:hypothetical protein